MPPDVRIGNIPAQNGTLIVGLQLLLFFDREHTTLCVLVDNDHLSQCLLLNTSELFDYRLPKAPKTGNNNIVQTLSARKLRA